MKNKEIDANVFRRIEIAMERNSDVDQALRRALLTDWSDGTTDDLRKTMNYVKMHRPEKYELYVSWVTCLARVADV